MYILIEGECYKLDLLESLFSDPKFYKINGLEATITSVGYYHSFETNKLVFMLPKVFMRDGEITVLDVTKDELVELALDTSIKHKMEFNWVRQLSVYFYNSLLEYRKRCIDSSLINDSDTFDLNTNVQEKEYSFLDILLSIANFYKKNKQQILFKHNELVSRHVNKVKWERTIRKSLPIITTDNIPIYPKPIVKKKLVDNQEELMTYFFSIVNHLNTEYQLNLKFDSAYKLIKGNAFDLLCKNGLKRLKKIKYRYFSDVLIKMYKLCELYFSQFDQSNVKRKREDFLSISNYNIVFEDMIDKLFSDDLKDIKVDGISINQLKHNDDGKIIDHIYSYESLIDTSDIFYIGDSKYYKSNSEAGKISRYKQFTYAKNVIQFNIDLLNKDSRTSENRRYRDPLTEGYNISPNFFIYGYIDDVTNYNSPSVEKKGSVIGSYHFKDRLFDRDTLFVHQYKINFLYVLKAYTSYRDYTIEEFRKQVKQTFRDSFIEFFNDTKQSGFILYDFIGEESSIEQFVNDNYRALYGKCFLTSESKLVLAVYKDDESLKDLIQSNFEFKKIK